MKNTYNFVTHVATSVRTGITYLTSHYEYVTNFKILAEFAAPE
jgi:hypothetical protein